MRKSIRKTAILLMALIGPATIVSAAWAQTAGISTGDQVVTTGPTAVMKGATRVCPLAPATSFRVTEVRGQWLGARLDIDGRQVLGWVKDTHVLKFDPRSTPLYAASDSLDEDQWQIVRLPRGVPLNIALQSDEPVDALIITEAAKTFLLVTPERRHRLVRPTHQELDTQAVTFSWKPRNRRQYYLMIENGRLPDDGADSRRLVSFSLACGVPNEHGPVELTPIDQKTGRGDFAASKYRNALDGIKTDETGRELTPLEIRWAEEVATAIAGTLVRGIEAAFKQH